MSEVSGPKVYHSRSRHVLADAQALAYQKIANKGSCYPVCALILRLLNLNL
jgi:hypothetical protein